MKLSTKGRYGLKAMFDIALYATDEPVSLTSVATRQNISLNYLEQLISPLRKAGLVKSIRGAQGGYLLAKDASDITVADILYVLEGNLAPTDCVKDIHSDEEDDCCTNADYCVTKVIYEKMYKSINEVVKSITLQDMVDDHNKLMESKKCNADSVFICN